MLALLPVAPPFPAGPAAAEPGAACVDVSDVAPGETEPSTQPNLPAVDLRVADAQQYVRDVTGEEPGAGVGVEVVGSGVVPIPELAPAGANVAIPQSWSATAVAGAVTGNPNDDVEGASGDSGESATVVGWAPAAVVFNRQAFTTDDDESDDGVPPETDRIVSVLDDVVADRRTNEAIKIVVLAFDLPESGRLQRAVQELSDAGLVVVAPGGDVVVDSTTEDSDDTGGSGSDETSVDFPAQYSTDIPGVVAVTSTVDSGTDPASVVKLGPQIDLAAPTLGAVSYAINGLTCDVNAPSSIVAAGEVAGLLALIAQVYPRDSAEELIARLEDTATGTVPSGRRKSDEALPVDPTLGRGIIQPLEALKRLPTPQRGGKARHNAPPEPDRSPVALPQPEPDRLADIRDNAVWWGLIGGGAVLVAAVLRPVIARRRRSVGE